MPSLIHELGTVTHRPWLTFQRAELCGICMDAVAFNVVGRDGLLFELDHLPSRAVPPTDWYQWSAYSHSSTFFTVAPVSA